MNATQRWIILLIVYSLFLLIGLAALGAVLGFFPQADEMFKKFALGTLITDIVAAAITSFKEITLGKYRVDVNLVFQGRTPADVALTSCFYEVRDGGNALKKKGEAVVTQGHGGWQCSFLIEPGEAINGYARLELKEHDNTVWRVSSFPLNNVIGQAKRVS